MNLKKLPTRFAKLFFCSFCLSSILSLTPASTLACGGGPTPETEYMGFFRSDLMMPKGRDFLRFAYEGEGSYLPTYSFESRPSNSEEGNYAEWKAIGNFSDADVKSFVYDSTLEQLKALKKALQNNNKYTGIAGAIPKYILKNKDAALLDYMIFAKTCAQDFALTEDRDPWDYRLKEDQESLNMALAAEQAMKSAPTDFLRLRYAYQAMRLYRARLDYDRCIELFETEIEPIPTNANAAETKDWCRAFYAGALYWKANYDQAFLEFSKVFQGSSRYRVEGYVGCRWVLRNSSNSGKQNQIIQAALKLAQTKQERMDVLVMAVYQNNFLDNFSDLEANNLDNYLPLLLEDIAEDRVPVPADLPLLIVWQINEAETALLPLKSPANKFNYYLPEMPKDPKSLDYFKTASQELKKTEELLEKLLEKSAVLAEQKSMPEQASSAVVQQNMLNTPSFWNACLGYMAYLRQDYPTAKSRFELAKTSAEPIPASVERQLEVLNVLLTATTAPLNAQGEELFEQGFQLLKPHAIIKEGSASSSNSSWESEQNSWLKRALFHIWGNILPARYYAAGEDAKAVLCLARADEISGDTNLSPSTYNLSFKALDNLQIPQLVELKQITSSPKTKFENELAATFNALWPASFLTEMQTTQLIRQYKFALAAGVFENQGSPKPEQGDSKLSISLYSSGYFEDTEHSRQLTLEPFKEPRAWGNNLDPKNEKPVTGADRKLLQTKVLPSLQPEIDRLRAQWIEARESKDPALQAKAAALQTQAANLEKYEVLLKNPTSGKYAFALQMAALEDLTSQEGELGAIARYALGKGLYNMNYSGNSNYLNTWTRSGSEMFLYEYAQDPQNGIPKTLTPSDYYFNDAAYESFLEAEKLSNNPELKARALFMAALCYQTQKTLYEDYPPKPTGTYFTDNPAFASLVKNYKDTEFYQAAYRACSYLRDFEKRQ